MNNNNIENYLDLNDKLEELWKKEEEFLKQLGVLEEDDKSK